MDEVGVGSAISTQVSTRYASSIGLIWIHNATAI